MDSLLIGTQEVPKVKRGRPLGNGANLRLLNRMKPGECVWDVPKLKMWSIRSSAFRAKIKLTIRLVESTGLYTIFKK